MQRNDRFNTPERNGTIVLIQWNGTERKSNGKLQEMKRDLTGNGRATAVPLHGIEIGDFLLLPTTVCVCFDQL